MTMHKKIHKISRQILSLILAVLFIGATFAISASAGRVNNKLQIYSYSFSDSDKKELNRLVEELHTGIENRQSRITLKVNKISDLSASQISDLISDKYDETYSVSAKKIGNWLAEFNSNAQTYTFIFNPSTDYYTTAQEQAIPGLIDSLYKKIPIKKDMSKKQKAQAIVKYTSSHYTYDTSFKGSTSQDNLYNMLTKNTGVHCQPMAQLVYELGKRAELNLKIIVGVQENLSNGYKGDLPYKAGLHAENFLKISKSESYLVDGYHSNIYAYTTCTTDNGEQFYEQYRIDNMTNGYTQFFYPTFDWNSSKILLPENSKTVTQYDPYAA